MLKIDQLIASHPQQFDLAGACTPEMIEAVEQKLNVILPQGLREFITRYGDGGEAGVFLSGIDPGNPLNEYRGTVLGDTLRMRKQYGLPTKYVVIQVDDDGVFWGLDTESTSERVLFFDTEGGRLCDPHPYEETYDEYTFQEFSNLIDED